MDSKKKKKKKTLKIFVDERLILLKRRNLLRLKLLKRIRTIFREQEAMVMSRTANASSVHNCSKWSRMELRDCVQSRKTFHARLPRGSSLPAGIRWLL